MRRTTIAALLAASLLLAFPGFTTANPPKQCYRGQGCGGFCLLNFSRIHQIGPLFNYGPYYGYPPFEPYGPWNAYLQYMGGPPVGGGYEHGHSHGDKAGHGGIWGRGGCGACGGHGFHAAWSGGGWFKGHGCLSCGKGGGLFSGHKSHGSGCSTCAPAPTGCTGCKADAFNPSTTDAVTRYAGSGSPSNAAMYYAALPSLDPAITLAGGIAK